MSERSMVFPLENSLCKNCTHRVSRLIVPLDYEDYDVDPNDFDLDEDEELYIEQHMCLILQQDMDSIIIECSHYSDKHRADGLLITTNPYV